MPKRPHIDEPRIQAVIEYVSQPFDLGQCVEVKFTIIPLGSIRGTMSLVVPVEYADRFLQGQNYAGWLRKI